MNQRISFILRCIVGVIFMLSGLLKAIDSAAFADLISEYGPVWLGIAAPFIIALEICLSLLLIFNIKPRWTATATVVFIVGVSLVYLYGMLFRGITSCGCFGPLTWLNSKPWLTFTRNALMVALLIPSLFAPQSESFITKPVAVTMASVGVIIMFLCGFSFRTANCILKDSYATYESKVVADTKLTEYITINPDSSYFVFVFSYTCPFCQNSVANVNQYVTMGAVDKVIGLAVEDPKGRERFDRLFDVDFEIQEISEWDALRLTDILPAAFHIRHDTIINSYTGDVISPSLFLE